jgi:hypothetical protein
MRLSSVFVPALLALAIRDVLGLYLGPLS